MSGVAADADDAMSRAMMQAQEKMPAAYASSILNADASNANASAPHLAVVITRTTVRTPAA
jgi:hypothetical protein